MTGNAPNAGTADGQHRSDAHHLQARGRAETTLAHGTGAGVEGSSSRQTRPAVLVGIPAYNEAARIAEVVIEARRYADEVLVVDDGSDDETATRAAAAGATVVVHDRNRGYGATLETIFRHAEARDAEHLVTLDGDGQHDPADIPKLVSVQEADGADLVVGSRFVGDTDDSMPTYRRAGLLVVNALANACMKARYASPAVADTQSGFRAYNRSAVEAIVRRDGIGAGMEASLDLLFQAASEGFTLEEVPTTVEYDVESPSSQNPALHGLALVATILGEMVSPRTVRTAGFIAVFVTVFGVVLAGSATLDGPTPGTVALGAVGFAAAIGLAFPAILPRLRRLTGR